LNAPEIVSVLPRSRRATRVTAAGTAASAPTLTDPDPSPSASLPFRLDQIHTTAIATITRTAATIHRFMFISDFLSAVTRADQ
jgi:hypothetical protein